MAYIGVPPADRTSGARIRDEFTADGTQVCFQLSQEVPGSFESNIIAVVENVIQEPVSAYTIINTVTLSLTDISDTFTLNETVTGGTSSAEGTVIQANLNNIVVRVTSGTFQIGEEITGGDSSATATTSAVETNVGKGILFSGTPSTGVAIYILHQASATYNLVPSAGSVTADSLSENLRTFTVDKFTATASQTAFTLTATPVSVKSILVFVDGVMQTETTHYTLSGATLTMGSGLASGQQVTVVHLGFSTVSRHAFTDGSVTTAMIADGAITSDKIATGGVATIDMADGSVTSLKIANGGIATADLADDAVTSAKIADDAVGIAQLSATGTADSTTFLRGDNSWQVVSVTPTAVSDQANTSTGYMMMPVGTTAQRPGTPAIGMYRMNSTTGYPEWYDTGTSSWIKFSNSVAYSVDYLSVAGGGGGGNEASGHAGGGGGAGGYIASTATVTPGDSYTIVIGGGGTAGGAVTGQGGNGSDTTISGLAITATSVGGGGGGGVNNYTVGSNGGSGGGGSGRGNTAGGSATSGQGYAGGRSEPDNNSGENAGGGGGGAGAIGTNGTYTSGGLAKGGNGGVGLNWQSLGTYYAGGGGGGCSQYNAGSYQNGVGGSGGGGNGAAGSSGGMTAGSSNTGGGGGGANSSGNGAAGGSGVVIIRYLGGQKGFGGTVTSSGGYTYHTFTSSGSYTA